MTELTGHSDEQLMVLLCAGCDEALAELVRRYQHEVFRFCLHYLRDPEQARDRAQETFLRVFRAREQFDSARQFKPWLLCIARNLCLTELKRPRMVSLDAIGESQEASWEERWRPAESTTAAVSPYDRLATDEQRRALVRALEALEPEDRELIVMRYFEQMSPQEMAAVLEIREGALRTRLHRALCRLRAICEERRDDLEGL